MTRLIDALTWLILAVFVAEMIAVILLVMSTL